ncbi:MAG TPA: SRPBCC domain-containing protein [Polyangiaceae bacterium]
MTEHGSLELDFDREFSTARALVFQQWIEAGHLGAWFAPAGHHVVDCSVDARPGGHWKIEYRSVDGEAYIERGEFIEVVPPELLRFTLINERSDGRVNFSTVVQVTFIERNGSTIMSFHQTGFTSQELLALVKQGWETCFRKLDSQVTDELEIRALFENWSRASERKDLQASMATIARNILSYEHDPPLFYRGVDALRAVCQAGFDHTPEGLRWDVPDLHVLIRGDIAVTWGLNHMYGAGVDMWSRGTLIFQRIDGRWQMIHQHVSFPVDPSSGSASTNLHPPRLQ